MSPLQLSILIHYYGCADDFRGGDFSAPAVRESIDWFLLVEMLEHKLRPGELIEAPNAVLKITGKGIFFVDYIRALPLPSVRYYFHQPTEQSSRSTSPQHAES